MKIVGGHLKNPGLLLQSRKTFLTFVACTHVYLTVSKCSNSYINRNHWPRRTQALGRGGRLALGRGGCGRLAEAGQLLVLVVVVIVRVVAR
jgi:hypothetical protein